MLMMIEERIRASDIRVEHRDALIRLREMIEDDLWASSEHPVQMHDPTQIEKGER